MTNSIKTTAVFLRPFQLPSFNETLPPGEYEIETQLLEPVDWIEPGTWTSSVLVRLHPRASHPGLSRTLTVPLAELEHAVAKDKLTGKALTDFFLEEMLADPMIRLVMQADGVAEAGPPRPLLPPVRRNGRQARRPVQDGRAPSREACKRCRPTLRKRTPGHRRMTAVSGGSLAGERRWIGGIPK
jgi:hypothetical protein